MSLVLDASPVLAVIFAEDGRAFGSSVLDRVQSGGGTVPPIFPLEVRNVLIQGERRKRISPQQAEASLADLELIGLVVDTQADLSECMRLSRRHGLTIYDASYLELAARRKLPLATLDAALIAAAKSEGVEVVTAQPA